MKWTLGMVLVLTVVTGLLVSCATAPTSRAEQEALVAEATSTLQQMRVEDPSLGELVRQSYGYALFPKVTKGGLGVGGRLRPGGGVRAGPSSRLQRSVAGVGGVASRGPDLQRAAGI